MSPSLLLVSALKRIYSVLNTNLVANKKKKIYLLILCNLLQMVTFGSVNLWVLFSCLGFKQCYLKNAVYSKFVFILSFTVILVC